MKVLFRQSKKNNLISFPQQWKIFFFWLFKWCARALRQSHHEIHNFYVQHFYYRFFLFFLSLPQKKLFLFTVYRNWTKSLWQKVNIHGIFTTENGRKYHHFWNSLSIFFRLENFFVIRHDFFLLIFKWPKLLIFLFFLHSPLSIICIHLKSIHFRQTRMIYRKKMLKINRIFLHK